MGVGRGESGVVLCFVVLFEFLMDMLNWEGKFKEGGGVTYSGSYPILSYPILYIVLDVPIKLHGLK